MIEESEEPPAGVELAPAPQAVDFIPDTEAGTLHGKAVKGAAYTAISQALKTAMSIGSQILLARLLLPAQFGIVAMVAPVLAFVSLFNDLGLSQAVIQREEITQADLSALYWLGLGVSSLLALIVVAVSPLVGMMYHQPAVGPVCAVLAVQLPVGALAGHSSALLARKLRFRAMATMEVISQAVGLVVSFLSVWAGAGYWSLVIGQLAATVTQAIGDRHLAAWQPSRPKWTSTVGPMLTFGANLTGFNLLSQFSLYCDNVLVGILRGPGALGLFDKAFSLVLRPVSAITTPVSRVATPLLSRSLNQPDTYRQAYLSMLQSVILLGGPGLITGSVLANEIVVTVLGKAWGGSGPIMTWICIAALFTSLSGSSYWIFTSQNRPNEQLQCGFVSSALILVSMLAGLPWGPIGIAKSYALFAPLVHGCFTWKATRKGPVRGRDVLESIYPLVLALPCAAFAVHALSRHLHMPALLRIVVCLGFSYLVTVSVTLVFPPGRRAARTLAALRHRATAPAAA